jgi:hypothetical protein
VLKKLKLCSSTANAMHEWWHTALFFLSFSFFHFTQQAGGTRTPEVWNVGVRFLAPCPNIYRCLAPATSLVCKWYIFFFFWVSLPSRFLCSYMVVDKQVSKDAAVFGRFEWRPPTFS